MAFIPSMIVRLGVDNRDVVRGYEQAIRKTEQFAEVTERVGQSLSLGLTAPILAFGAASAKAAADIESLRLGLDTIATSAADAALQYDRLVELAKRPGIGFEESIQGSIRLQNVGFSALGAERSLKAFANAIALTGGGKAELNSVTVQLGQLSSKGKVLAQDLRPIIEAAPVVGRVLRSAFGTVDSEQIQKLNLSTEEFLETLLSGLEALPEAQGGLRNAFDNLADSAKRALGGVLEDETINLTRAIDGLAERLEYGARVFNALDPVAKRVAISLTAMAAAIGPTTYVMGRLAVAFAGARAGMLVLAALPTRVAAGFRNLNSALIATQAGLRFNAAAGQFQAASGVFVARSQAMALAATGTSKAVALMRLTLGGVVSVLTGPVGIALALTAAAAAFTKYKVDAARAKVATDDFRTSLIGLDRTSLDIKRAALDQEIFEIEWELSKVPATREVSRGHKEGWSSIQPNPKHAELLAQLDEARTKMAAVEQAMEQLDAAAAAADGLGDFGGGVGDVETRLDQLGETVKRLTGIFDSLRARGDSVIATVAELVPIEQEIERLIRSQGDKRTEDLAKALDLSVQVRAVWDEIFSRIQNSVVKMPESPKKVVGGPGGLLIDTVQARAIELGKSFQFVTIAAREMETSVFSLSERISGVWEAFKAGIENSKKNLYDALTQSLMKKAYQLGLFVGPFINAVRGVYESISKIASDPGALLTGKGLMAALGPAVSGIAQFVGQLRNAVTEIALKLYDVVNPVKLFGSVLDQIARNMAPNFEAALAPLADVFGQLADAITPIVAVIAEALRPVLEALVPVFEALGPVVGALARALAPILTALVPLLDVFRIVLEALFPIIKAVAIAFTYVGQVFFTISGWIQIVVGKLIYALGWLIDKIPGLGDFGLKGAGNALVKMGESSLAAADALDEAREKIREVEIGDALDYVATAAQKAASSLSNVPEIFDYVLRRRQAAATGIPAGTPLAGSGPTDIGGSIPTTQGGGGGGLTVEIHNPPANLNVAETVRQIKQALKSDPEFRVMVQGAA